MRRASFILATAVLLTGLLCAVAAAQRQGGAQQQGGAAAGGVFIFVNESAARASVKARSIERPRPCADGCGQQRSIAPVRRDKDLAAQARKLIDTAGRQYADGKFTEAADTFRRAARLKPNYEAFIGLGESQYRLKQPTEALASYAQALKLNPKLDVAHYNIGLIRYEQKAYADALASFKAAVDIAPADAEEYYYYGLTLNELKRRDEAIAALREAVGVDQHYTAAYIALASVLDGAERRTEAADLLRRLTRLEPAKGQGFFELGNVLHNDRKYEDAVAAYQQAARLTPNDGTVLSSLADSMYSLGRSAETVANYEKAFALRSELKKDWGVVVRYGNSLRQIGRTKDAIQWLNTAIAINPKDDTPHYLIGIARFNSTPPDYAGAIDALVQASRLNPDRKETFLLLTAAYINASPRMPTEALQAARRAQHLAPNDARTLAHVGMALAVGQVYEPAYEVLDQAVRLDPNDGTVLGQLCNVAMLTGRYKEGLPKCLRAVELSGPESKILNRIILANMYAVNKRYDEAISEVNAVLKEEPGSAFAYMALGNAYLLQKKYDRSIDALKQALRLAPESPEVHLNLGVTYAEAGKPAEAAVEYAVLLNLNPGYAAQLKAVMDEGAGKKRKK
jgi:tetratricopeptide (TPR) repeat protein